MGRSCIFLLSVLAFLSGCRASSEVSTTPPVVVVGIDGASWVAIRDLWDQGRLPNLRALAERGVSSDLQPVADISPVIWTSMATGVLPERHGITDFLLPTSEGDVPVSSSLRKVPAIWNMLTTLDRRVAVLGWWVSWPAEEINGIEVTDRALKTQQQAVYPPEFATRLRAIVEAVPDPEDETLQAEIARQDQIMGLLAQQLLGESFDLLLVYLRSPDVASHPFWKYFQVPESEEVDAEKIDQYGERVPLAYEAVDRIVGDLVAKAPAETNFFVVSDHGFTAVEGQQYRMLVDLNVVLEHLGYLHRRGSEIDWATSRAVTWNSPAGLPDKMVRIGLDSREPRGPVAMADLDQIRQQLIADLGEVVYVGGAPVFHVRWPRSWEEEQGADLTVMVNPRARAKKVFYREAEIPGVVEYVEELTGTHSVETPGILIAAGPDIDAGFPARAIHSLDITPTLLFALGLPVAEDFDGTPRTRLFREEFRQRHPLTTIPSWGILETGTPVASEMDEDLKKELRALGYID